MSTYTQDQLAAILADHRAWLAGEKGIEARAVLRGADLTGANLTDADLRGADLTRADLTRAVLTGAVLRGADLTRADLTRAVLTGAVLTGAVLTRADLTDAVLTGADLTRADLTRADLRGAVLTGANLTRAVLTDADLPAGYRWEAYLAEVVPALLMAGGKPLADVLAALKARGGWAACHQWSNCPLHEAFGADGLDGVPPLYRWEAAQFVQLFDAGLIPEPTWPGEAALAARGGEGVGNG